MQQFLSFGDSVQAELSDCRTSIKATIASSAVEAFGEKYHKRVTDGTRGGILQLLQFEIVATHHGPLSDRLTLRILDFRHLGSDGEGIFGDPQPITRQVRVIAFLDDLKALRGQSTTRRAAGLNGHQEEPFYSQGSNSEPENSDDSDSQPELATQQPRRKLNKRLLSLSRETIEKDKIMSAVLDFRSRDGVQVEIGEDRPGIYHKQGPTTVTSVSDISSRYDTAALPVKAKLLNTPAQLLGLLDRQYVRSVRRNVVIKHNGDTKIMTKSPTPTRTIAEPNKIELVEAHEVAPIIDEAALSEQVSLMKPSSISATSSLVKSLAPNVAPLGTSANVNDNLSDTEVLDARVAETTKTGIGVIDIMEDSEDLWPDMSRIRRKDVTIPKNQQTLLDRKDCWLPPEPGSRGPIANVPFSILQSFTATIEGHVEQTNVVNDIGEESDEASGNPSRSMSPELDTRHSSVQRDVQGIPFSSKEWPPSSAPEGPAYDRLPPDSSMEVSPARAVIPTRRPGGSGTIRTPSLNRETTFVTGRESPEDSEEEVSYHGEVKELDNEEGQFCKTPREVKGQQAHLSNDREVKYQHLKDPQSTNRSCINSIEVQESPVLVTSAEPIHEILNEAASSPDRTDLMKSGVRSEDELFVSHCTPIRKIRSASIGLETSLPTSLSESEQGPGDAHLASISAPTSEPDLETTVPTALGNQSVSNPRPATPKSSFYIQVPTLQVDRTPYIVGSKRKRGTSGPDNIVTKHVTNESENGHKTERHISISDDDYAVEDLIPGTFSQPERTTRSDVGHSRLIYAGRSHSPREYASSDLDREAENSLVQPTRSPLSRPKILSKTAGKVEIMGDASKSTNIIKRRKRPRLPEVYLREDSQPLVDPSIRARQLRRDFLNKHRALGQTTALPLSLELSRNESRDHGAQDAELITYHDNVVNAMKIGPSRMRSTGTQTPEATSPQKALPSEEDPSAKSNREVHQERKHIGINALSATTPRPKSRHVAVFDSFRCAYPAYMGNEKHFVAMCRKILTLEMENRMEHKSLWDDFIIRHQMEYRQHLLGCTEQAEDPMPYEKFYRAEIDRPQFNKGIVSPISIAAVIATELQTVDVALPKHDSPGKGTIDLAQGTQDQISTFEPLDIVTQNTETSRSRMGSPPLPHSSKATGLSSPILSSQPLKKRTPRSLPWKSQKSVSASPTRSRPSHDHIKTMAMAPSILQPIRIDVHSPSAPQAKSATVLRHALSATETLTQFVVRASDSINTTKETHLVPRKSGDTVQRRDIIPASTFKPLSVTSKPAVIDESLVPLSATNGTSNKLKSPLYTTSTPWYLDPVNPFRSFARADAAIRNGNGNGFIEEKDKQIVREKRIVVENGVVLAKKRKIDVLTWEL